MVEEVDTSRPTSVCEKTGRRQCYKSWAFLGELHLNFLRHYVLFRLPSGPIIQVHVHWVQFKNPDIERKIGKGEETVG